jgi:hypothetical protein
MKVSFRNRAAFAGIGMLSLFVCIIAALSPTPSTLTACVYWMNHIGQSISDRITKEKDEAACAD